MSRATKKEPNPSEIKFVKDVLLKGQDPLWIRWVTKRKRDKVQDRLIVIGQYRVFSIKKTLTGNKQVQREAHIYDLHEISCKENDRIILKFATFEIDLQSEGASIEVVEILRRTFQKISCGFPLDAVPKVTFYDNRSVPELSQIDFGPAYGLLASYEAWCDYFKLSPSQEFIQFIHDLHNQGKTQLNIDECPGIERRSEAIHFVPIRNALRYNTFFNILRLKDIPSRRDISLAMGDILSHNYTIHTLILNHTAAPDQAFINIGQGLKKNSQNVIRELDFSGNPMKDKGMAGLAEGIQALTHPLSRVNIPVCGLSSKGIGSLVQALSFGQQAMNGLQELDLSFNNIGNSGSLSLSNLFSQMNWVQNLKYLFLSSCKLDAALVLKNLKNGNCRTLEIIDLSGNRIDSLASQSLASLIDTLHSLTQINLSYCNLQGSQVNTILSAIVGNQGIHNARVDISNNELGPTGATSVSNIIAHNTNIVSLIMRSCEFKKEGLSKIADGLKQNNALTALDLSLNFRSGTPAKMQKVITELAEAVKNHSKIKYLGLAGDFGKYVIGKEILPLFKIFNENPELIEINISGNKIGDTLAIEFCNNLQNNIHLKSFSWDRNFIGVGGWQALLNLLNVNRSICHIPFPKSDYDKVEKEGKHPKLQELFESINAKLRANCGGIAFESILSEKIGRTYDFIQSEGGHLTHSPSFSNDLNNYDYNYQTDNSIPSAFDDSYPPPPPANNFVGQEFDDTYGQEGNPPPPPPPLPY